MKLICPTSSQHQACNSLILILFAILPCMEALQFQLNTFMLIKTLHKLKQRKNYLIFKVPEFTNSEKR